MKVRTGFALLSASLAVNCSGGGGGDKADRDVIVGLISGPVSEAGDQATFTVVLRARPSSDVTIPLSSSEVGEGTVAPASLTFTRDNWDAPQTVSVSGVDDADKDGNATFAIALEPIVSTDEVYAALDPSDVTVTNLDNESAGVLVSPDTSTTTEMGGSTTIDVRLQSRPTADVLLIFGTSDLSEANTDVQTMTFTSSNWDAPQTITVTGVNDDLADGLQSYSILFQSSLSDDPEYAFLPIPSLAMANIDDDTAGILFSESTAVVSETGTTATVMVSLLSRPAATVSLTFDQSDNTEIEFGPTGTAATASLLFTGNNWNTPQPLVVRGDTDTLSDGDQNSTVDIITVTTTDPAYQAVARPKLYLVTLDDDSPGFVVTAPTGPTSETGGQATFTVGLRSTPSATVTMNLTSSLPGEATVSPTTLNFSSTTTQTVTVTGVADFKRDGHRPFNIQFSPATSTDANYATRQVPNVGNTNIDNGPVRKVLVFDDVNGTLADDAVDARGFDVVTVSNTTSFDAVFDQGGLDFIVMESTSALLPVATETRLSDWVDGGGRLIISQFDLGSRPALASALRVSANQVPSNNLLMFPAVGPIPSYFVDPNTFPGPLASDDVAFDFASELTLTSSGTLAARFTNGSTGAGAIASTKSGRVVVNGFSADDYASVDAEATPDGIKDLQELYSNEIASLFRSRYDLSPNAPVGPAVMTTNSQMLVSGVPGTILKTRVSFYISHPQRDHLDIRLIAPDGTSVTLINDGGGTGDNYGSACTPDTSRIWFDQASATLISSQGTANNVTGIFRPTGNLSSLNGKNANGIWTLSVADDTSAAPTTAGFLVCWSLVFEY